jgi:hypothetical protein
MPSRTNKSRRFIASASFLAFSQEHDDIPRAEYICGEHAGSSSPRSTEPDAVLSSLSTHKSEWRAYTFTFYRQPRRQVAPSIHLDYRVLYRKELWLGASNSRTISNSKEGRARAEMVGILDYGREARQDGRHCVDLARLNKSRRTYFACPFYKHEPTVYGDWTHCVGPCRSMTELRDVSPQFQRHFS